MNESHPEGTRDNRPASSAAPGLSPESTRESVPGLSHASGLPRLSFSGYVQDKLPPLTDQPLPVPPAPPRLRPNILHTLLFFIIAYLMMILTSIGASVIYQLLQHGPQSHTGLDTAFNAIQGNPTLSTPTQTVAYALLVLLSIPIFESIWFESFGEVLHWNFRHALHIFWSLLGVGLLAGFAIGSLGNLLPMPKSPPIIHDLMSSTTGAWLMLLFGITAAPITEELAFRGFLLPSLINIFALAERRGFSTQAVTRYIGIPVAIVLTTIAFTLIHAPQLSDSWGPLLLIATISILLCIVRLVTDSVAASVVVHSAYNLVIFASVVYQTNGFEHLHRLAS